DDNGCFSEPEDCALITIWELPISDAGIDYQICSNGIDPVVGGTPTAALGTGPYTYLWTGSGAAYLDDGTAANPTFDVDLAFATEGAGIYTVCVEVTDFNGCVNAVDDCADITVWVVPDCTITAEDVVCAETQHTASVPDAGVGATYVWTVTGGTLDSGQGTREIIYTAASGATVTLDVTVEHTSTTGCSKSCSKVVDIYACFGVNIEIQGLTGGTVDRAVTFVITDCDGVTETRVEPVTFIPNVLGGVGEGYVLLTGVDPDADWLAAKEGHTLRTTKELSWVGGFAAVAFIDADKLISGDLSNFAVGQDELVDITDFSILAANWESGVDPNQSSLADVSGDGYQNGDDFAVMQGNFFFVSDAENGCTKKALGSVSIGLELVQRSPRASITVDELSRSMANAARADLTSDGVVDVRDIRAFIARYELDVRPEFEELLVELEDELELTEEEVLEPMIEPKANLQSQLQTAPANAR
ncbi:MAG: hypothetical protein KAV82_14875, partial [Phycisphaerae bacterium]|nr:hypothetical protein [Phycisphaerae bacterium]